MPLYAVAEIETAPFNGRAPEVRIRKWFSTRHRERQAAEAELAKRQAKAKALPPQVGFTIIELPELSEAGDRDRRAAMATFTEHFGACGGEDRRAIVGVLLGKGRPINGQMKAWGNRHWECFRKIVTEHAAGCPGDCEILKTSRNIESGRVSE